MVGGLDLAATSVFLDFDGTATEADVTVHVLERLAPAAWHEVEAEYTAGAIGSRECLVRQWALVDQPVSEAALRSIAAEVPVDPALAPLVTGLLDRGAEVTVVSDGLGFYVESTCRPLGVPVLTNGVDFATGQLLFPNVDRCCPCSTCGTCKQAPIKEARRRGRSTVLVGDGASDRKAALLADRVFAKGALAGWCEAAGVDAEAFESLADVARALLPRR
jgi:2-hydroxy-3-keto-5-methylthiopentenyl-1-phosphate phosphatase